MDNFQAVLKLENHSGVAYDTRRIFTGLGDDPESYPFETGDPNQFHCFLRFASPVFAEYALNHQISIDGVRVLPVYQNPRLIAQFHAVLRLTPTSPQGGGSKLDAFNSQRGYEREPTERNRSETGLYRANETSKRRKICRSSFSRSDDRSIHSDIFSSTKNTGTSPAIQLTSAHFRPQTRECNLSLNIVSSSKDKPAIKLSPPTTSATRDCSDVITSPGFSPEYPPASAFPLSLETHISLKLYGETIPCDLKELDPDPQPIIELLKAAESERGNYIVVGAFYRRCGNPKGARAVLLAMIEELVQRGIALKELKSSFLLLSGCEVDLAKQAEADKKDASIASGHYAAAQAWLQKVFGKAVPLPSKVDHKENHQAGAKHSTPTRPRALSRPSEKEINWMKQEIQTLRSRNTNQATQLHELRVSKRKVDEDYLYERNLRRKYQWELVDMAKERDSARKLEKYALDQTTREVSARRAAEERVEALAQ